MAEKRIKHEADDFFFLLGELTGPQWRGVPAG